MNTKHPARIEPTRAGSSHHTASTIAAHTTASAVSICMYSLKGVLICISKAPFGFVLRKFHKRLNNSTQSLQLNAFLMYQAIQRYRLDRLLLLHPLRPLIVFCTPWGGRATRIIGLNPIGVQQQNGIGLSRQRRSEREKTVAASHTRLLYESV